MKVLIFKDSLQSGGAERRLVELLKGLSATSKFHFDLVLMNKEVHYTDIFKIKNVTIHYLVRDTKRDLKIFSKFFRLCKQLKPDVVHTWDLMTSFYTLPVVALSRIPWINGRITIAPLTIKPFSPDWFFTKITYYFSDLVLANSKAGLKVFRVPEKKALCIYNGFDFNRLANLKNTEAVKNEFDIKTPFAVCMVASFTKVKDYNTFFAAAEIITGKRNDITFMAIGEGDNYLFYKNKYPNSSLIKLLGRQKDVESIVNCCDSSVLCSAAEGISNSLMESMALGKPVIATSIGGTPELVINNDTGFIIGFQACDTLVQKIEYLINNPEVKNEMGQKGKKRIEQNFSQQVMNEKFFSLYSKYQRGSGDAV